MRQFTTPEQTAKLIGFGFAEPNSEGVRSISDTKVEFYPAYSIGELIEMLPPKVGTWNLSIERYWEFELWIVSYNPFDCFSRATELRDALYNMIVKIKGDGVI